MPLSEYLLQASKHRTGGSCHILLVGFSGTGSSYALIFSWKRITPRPIPPPAPWTTFLSPLPVATFKIRTRQSWRHSDLEVNLPQPLGGEGSTPTSLGNEWKSWSWFSLISRLGAPAELSTGLPNLSQAGTGCFTQPINRVSKAPLFLQQQRNPGVRAADTAPLPQGLTWFPTSEEKCGNHCSRLLVFCDAMPLILQVLFFLTIAPCQLTEQE